MAPNPQLESPGSSSYSSNVTGLHVGDGTWDSGRDDFLLPNLVGLPFDVMRYNGMGNRFAGIPQYHHIVTGHGVMAAITFLFIVPAAIMVARFYHRNPVLALRTHVWLQIITVFFATVVLILGWFAVGPKRSLTNPHHGIGVAIYTLIMFQALFGAWVRHHEGKRFRDYVPIKLMVRFLRLWDVHLLMGYVAAPMAGQSDCSSCHCSGCAWTHALWLSKVPLRPLHPLGLLSLILVLCSFVSPSTRIPSK